MKTKDLESGPPEAECDEREWSGILWAGPDDVRSLSVTLDRHPYSEGPGCLHYAVTKATVACKLYATPWGRDASDLARATMCKTGILFDDYTLDCVPDSEDQAGVLVSFNPYRLDDRSTAYGNFKKILAVARMVADATECCYLDVLSAQAIARATPAVASRLSAEKEEPGGRLS